MREILFRGKRTGIGDSIWIEGSILRGVGKYDGNPKFFIYSIDTEISPTGNIDYFDYIPKSNKRYPGERVIPETVGQFTGLLDKNGKKIFEGDIVSELWSWREKGEENYYIVRWDNGSCGFEPFSDSLKNCGHCGGGINPKECEVIGNIHDNPDLMLDNESANRERMDEYVKSITSEFMKSST